MEKALNSRNFMQYAESMSTFGELPELYNLIGVEQPKEHHPEGDAFAHTLRCLEECDRYSMSPEVKFAVLCHDFGKAVTWKEHGNLFGHEAAGVPVAKAFCERMRVPKAYEELALAVTEFHTDMHTIIGRPGQNDKKPNKVMKLLERTGSLKNNRRAIDFANSCSMDQAGRGLPQNWSEPYPQADIFLACQAAVVTLDVKPISARLLERGVQGVWIGEAIRVERIDAIRKVLREMKEMRKDEES
jgi:tRNA nucleotidyltransferase (CCA-adding enzyme)